MNRKSVLLVIGVAALAVQPALGAYQSIQMSADGVNDASYVGGVLTIAQPATGTFGLTLNDPGIAAGEFQNIGFNLTTEFTQYVPQPPANPQQYPNGYADFHNGSYSLTFDWRPAGSGDPFQSFYIMGNMIGFRAYVEYSDQFLTTIKGEGLFPVSSYSLPGSNEWTEVGGSSSIQTLTLSLENTNLSGYEWAPTSSLVGGDTTYTLFPNANAVPEPVSLVLLGFGGLALLRRRR